MKIQKFHILIYILRAEGFLCSLDVLYGGLGICKLCFLIKKFLFSFQFFSIFGHQNLGSGFSLKCLIRISNEYGSETLVMRNN
jgi:hypothetical protein